MCERDERHAIGNVYPRQYYTRMNIGDDPNRAIGGLGVRYKTTVNSYCYAGKSNAIYRRIAKRKNL